MSPRVFLCATLLASAGAWPFGKQGGNAVEARPDEGGAAASLTGFGDVSADELRQAQAMMNDPAFMQQMLGQLKDPRFMSQLKESLASPESRRIMQQMGMAVPSDEEIAAAMDKLESPEFQAQLHARAEAAMGTREPGGKMAGSRLSNSKVDQSGQQADTPVLGAA